MINELLNVDKFILLADFIIYMYKANDIDIDDEQWNTLTKDLGIKLQ